MRRIAKISLATQLTRLRHRSPVRSLIDSFQDLKQMKEMSVAKHGDAPVFGTKNQASGRFEWMSYKDWGTEADAFAAVLSAFGVEEGDRVAVISNNRVEWAIGSFGSYAVGAVYVPMYEAQSPQDWKYILEDSGAKVLLVAREDIYHKTKGFAGQVGQIERVLSFDAPHESSHCFHFHIAKAKNGAYPPAPEHTCKPDDLASLIYTSGTTGVPKGVELTHGNLASNVTGVRKVFPNYETDIVRPGDVSLAFLPWAHCYGQNCELHSAIAAGSAIGIAESNDKILENLDEVRPTVLFSVPTLFKRVYDGVMTKIASETPLRRNLFDAALQASRKIRHAKTECRSPDIFTKVQHAILDRIVLQKIRNRLGGRLRMAFAGGAATPCYGLTETSPIVVINSNEYPVRKLGTAGIPVADVVVKIVRNGVEMPLGEEGEICVSGPNVMRGYWNKPEANAEVFFELDGDLFFRTGRATEGCLSAACLLTITGRLKEQYKLENGKYVVPGPLEEILCTSPFIQQAVVWGDNRPFNVALLVPERAVFDPWLIKNKPHLAGEEWEKIVAEPAVQELFHGEVEMVVARNMLKKYEVPKRWYLVEESFSTANGFLTPKLSLKRHIILKVYQEKLDELYSQNEDQNGTVVQPGLAA
eukprot:scaffold164_cov340-Pinguiococcus_pyrenoidosus.AAC.8